MLGIQPCAYDKKIGGHMDKEIFIKAASDKAVLPDLQTTPSNTEVITNPSGSSLRRFQLFEFEDQHWLPTSIRNGITDFLQFAVEHGNVYSQFSGRLGESLRRCEADQIIDLCSGGGGTWKSLLKSIPELHTGEIKVHLTDYYPNCPAFQDLQSFAPQCFSFSTQSVSALKVESGLHGFRTLFSSFHHFDETQATQILTDAISKNQGIAIAESTQRHILMIIYMLFTPILVVLSTFLQKPFRWTNFFWTFLIPAIPLAVAFDGIVSCLRTYTPQELVILARSIPGHENFEWQAGIDRHAGLPVGVTYLIGIPLKK